MPAPGPVLALPGFRGSASVTARCAWAIALHRDTILLDCGDRMSIRIHLTQEPTNGKSTAKNPGRSASKARR